MLFRVLLHLQPFHHNLRFARLCGGTKKASKQKALTCKDDCKTNSKANVSSLDKEREEDIDKERDIEKERKRESDALTHSDLFDSDLDAFSTEQEQRDRAKIKRLGGSLGQGVVLLSDAQMDHLLDVLSGEEFDHYVSVIAENELKGRKYKRKTHYQAILDMAQKDRRL